MRYHEFLLEYDRAKAMAGFGGKLQARLKADTHNKDMSLEQLFAKLEQADPSTNKQYVNWMARAYQNGSELEDLISRGADNLAKLDQLKLKKQVKPEHSDVGKFKTLPELEAVLDQYQIAKPEPEVDHGEYKEVVNNNNVRIIQWFDEKAAKYYGQGTKWCTAAERNNMASQYLHNFNLFVFIPKHPTYPGEKYQLAIEKTGKGIQLMDEKDAEVNALYFRNRFPEVYNLPVPKQHIVFISNPSLREQLTAVQRNGFLIKYINNPSEQVQLAAVQQNGAAVGEIKSPSEIIKLAAVQKDPFSIQLIENPSEQMQLIAVRRHGSFIDYIENPTEEVKLASVQQNGINITYIKDPSEQVQIVAVEDNEYAIKRIENQCQKAQEIAVSRDGWLIEYCKNPSEHIQLIAVNNIGYAIQFIKNPSEEVQLAAVRKHPDAFEYINKPTPKVKDYIRNLRNS